MRSGEIPASDVPSDIPLKSDVVDKPIAANNVNQQAQTFPNKPVFQVGIFKIKKDQSEVIFAI